MFLQRELGNYSEYVSLLEPSYPAFLDATPLDVTPKTDEPLTQSAIMKSACPPVIPPLTLE
jgi:hypothetical protein